MKYLLMVVLVLALLQPSLVEAKVRSSVRIAPKILRTVPKKSQPVVLPKTRPNQPGFIGPVKPVAPIAPRSSRVWGWNPFRGNFFMWMWFWK